MRIPETIASQEVARKSPDPETGNQASEARRAPTSGVRIGFQATGISRGGLTHPRERRLLLGSQRGNSKAQ